MKRQHFPAAEPGSQGNTEEVQTMDDEDFKEGVFQNSLAIFLANLVLFVPQATCLLVPKLFLSDGGSPPHLSANVGC